MQKHFVHEKFQIDCQIDHFIVGNEKPIPNVIGYLTSNIIG